MVSIDDLRPCALAACLLSAPAFAQAAAAAADSGPAMDAAAPESLGSIAVTPPQDPSPPLPAEPSRNRLIEEVVVTAQKREERLQDVPISIQAFSGESLAAQGIENTEQLGTVVPSLQFTSVAGFSLVYIRGLGTDNFIPSADPSIATYIDGIYIPNGADTSNSLGGIQRVEVLKGPQGTLFGRNATGGAISIVTEEPGDVFKGMAEGEIGNFNKRALKASVSGPITDWLSAGVSGGVSRQDSYYDHLRYDDLQADGLKELRGKINFHPSDTLSLSLTAYYSRQQGLGSVIGKNTDPTLLGTAVGIQAQDDNYTAETDLEPSTGARQSINYAILSWKLPSVDLKLLGSYQRLLTFESEIDFDGSPLPLVSFSGDHIFTKLATGELQILSNDNTWAADRFKWVAGLYYLDSSAGVDPAYFRAGPQALSGALALGQQPQFTALGERLTEFFDAFGLQETPLGSGGLALGFRGVLATESASAYAQGTFTFTDWVDLTLGGRVQRERRFLTDSATELANFNGDGTTTVLPFSLKSETEINFSPKAVLSLHPSDDALLYASYSVGYKSGTFNIVNIYTPPNYIVPEKVTTFEVGAKLQLFDGLLRINGAVFNNKIDNLQSGFVSLLSGGAVRFLTVPGARSRGAEIDGTWVPMPDWNPGLAITGNAAYIDATYTDFDPCPGFATGTGIYSQNLDCDNNRITRTPKFSGGVGALQAIEGAQGTYEIAVDEYYNSGFFYDALNTVKEKRYSLLNARLGYLHTPWNLRLTLFGQNLLDRKYHYVQFQNDFGVVKTLSPPRQYGLRLRWDF